MLMRITALSAAAALAAIALVSRAGAEGENGGGDGERDLSIAAAGANGQLKLVADLERSAAGVVARTRFVLDMKTPGPPQVRIRFEVTAADDATAAGVAAALAVGAAAGIPIDQAAPVLAQAGLQFSLGARRAGPLEVGALQGEALDHLAELVDGALFSVGPGGGCEVFRRALAALGLAGNS